MRSSGMRDWVVRVPASSANVGPAFDALGIALATHLEVRPGGAEPAGPTHPAVRAFHGAGGSGSITVTARFPGGRGLGFSGAARIGGLVAAALQRGDDVRALRPELLAAAAGLEGHAENAAASLYGGIVVASGGAVVRVRTAVPLAVAVWIPEHETSTKRARSALPATVGWDDATFNVGRAALLVAALAAGELDVLRAATEDRLHQDRRLEHAPESRAAITAALGAGALGAWLSGSGPTVAAFVAAGDDDAAARVVAAFPPGGRARVLAVDDAGTVCEGP